MPDDRPHQEGSSKKTLQSILPEIGQQGLKYLYACSKIRGLTAGEILIEEGSKGQDVYIILEGELDIIKSIDGHPKKIASLSRGDWVGEIAFTKKVSRTASAVARIPSRVIAINEDTLKALDTQTQLFFLKRLNGLANERIAQLTSNEDILKRLNKKLINHIHSEHSKFSINYSQAHIIREIIKKVPRLPSFATTLISHLAQPNASFQEIANLIKQDPSSVAVVLKAVNSAYYGLGQKITDINHALVLIGFGRIHQLIIAEGLRQTLPNTASFNAIQSHSVAISHIAYGISLTSRVGKPSEMATVGLLHDLGRGLILLLKKQNPSLGILIDFLDHTQLGALLLEQWGMPTTLVDTLRFQSYPKYLPPERIPPDVGDGVVALYLAHRCLDILEGKADVPEDLFQEEHLERFGWDQKHLTQIVQEQLLPTWVKDGKGYPVDFRSLLVRYVSRQKSSAKAMGPLPVG